jgi:hypothetical protein
MNPQPNDQPMPRVRMRTDGPPVPLYRLKETPPPIDENFLTMSRRRLPGLLAVMAGAVLFGGLLGQALAATAQDLDKDADQTFNNLYARNLKSVMML